MVEVPAVKIQQHDVVLLVTALSLGDLRMHVDVDKYQPDNPEGYQRPLVDRRLAEIGKYVTEEHGVLPTSILLCAREGEGNTPEFLPEGEVGDFAQSGTLRIPDGAKLWIVDGQHRHGGIRRAFERGSTELASFTFPVTIMMGVDRYQEMRYFSTINTQQRKMQTDIVDRHLVQIRERDGIRMINAPGRTGRKGEREFHRAKCTSVIDLLNELPGPWYHQVSIPGVPGRESGLVRQHAMVASLELGMRDSLLFGSPDDVVADLLARYWRALETVWPEAFAEPNSYRVQATVGVYSLHMVFPIVLQYCYSIQNHSEEKMVEVWEETGITSVFWNKEDGDPYTLGTGMGSIRALGYFLRSLLPQASFSLL